MSNAISIGAAANERYFPGLIGMVSSVLINTQRDLNIEFHIIDGGIKESSWDLLLSTVAKINPNAKIINHQIDLSVFDYFPKDFGGGVLAYARLLFPDILNINQLIYIDSDVLIFKDIQELWLLDLEGAIMSACQDPLYKTIDQDCTVYDQYGIDPKAPHFNTGVVKIDLEKWRAGNISAKTIQYIIKHPTECKFWDQSALNITLYGKVKFINTENNFFAEHFNIQNRSGRQYNIHFLMKKKPWLYYHTGTSYQLFYELMDVLNIQLNDPGYLKSFHSNKYKNKYASLFLIYLKVKVILFKYIGNDKKHRIAESSFKYWELKTIEKKNNSLMKENLTYLENWKSSIQILK